MTITPRTALRKTYRAVTDPRRSYRESIVLRDYARYRAGRSQALRRARPRRASQGRVLIVSLSDQIFQLKLEGLLSTALRLEGYRPIVLTLRNSRWAEPYLRAAGVEDFVYASDLMDPADEAEAAAVTRELLAGDVGVQSLKAFEFHGAKVGQQTLSSLSRGFQRGRISLDDDDVRAALPDVLGESVRAVLGGEALLSRERPDLVIFNEKGYAGFGSIYDVALARGTNVIQFVNAGIHWRDALLFKRYTEETRRVHPASLSQESWELVRAMDWDDRREAELRGEFEIRYGSGEKHPDAGLQEGKRIKTRAEVAAQLGLDPAKKTAVLYSHVLWDANLFYGDDLFEDQETWLVETVRAAVANPRVNWIVKLHPANMYKAGSDELNDEVAIREAVGELPPHVKLLRPDTDINTYSLFDVADYGITIRGTIGMELPCFGIPTLTAGTGRYSGLGFTNDSASADEYLAKLARIEEIPPPSEEETLLGKKHAYGLFRLRPFRFTSFRAQFLPASQLDHPLSHNLELLTPTREAVESAADLRDFARWALNRRLLDYLSPP
jgi:hypothetical protein